MNCCHHKCVGPNIHPLTLSIVVAVVALLVPLIVRCVSSVLVTVVRALALSTITIVVVLLVLVVTTLAKVSVSSSGWIALTGYLKWEWCRSLVVIVMIIILLIPSILLTLGVATILVW